MLSCSIWFSAPSFWMGGGLESRCVGRVYGAIGAVLSHGTNRTVHTTYAAALKTHPKTRCRKPYAATQHLTILMMGVCIRNMSSKEYINKINSLHQVGIPHYFTKGSIGIKITVFWDVVPHSSVNRCHILL